MPRREVTRAAVERDWAARGFSGGLWVDPPGRRWEDFTHAQKVLGVSHRKGFWMG